MRGLWLGLLLLGVMCSSAPARAHDARPLTIHVRQLDQSRFEVTWTLPSSLPRSLHPNLKLPPVCKAIGGSAHWARPGSVVRQAHVHCAESPANMALLWEPPDAALRSPTMLRVEWQGEGVRTLFVPPGDASFELPGRNSLGSLSQQYLGLGISHLLHGYDHLLFVLCLLILSGSRAPDTPGQGGSNKRPVFMTVSGFTLGHSLTLAVATLGRVTLPIPPVEAGIALSIVLVAGEIVRGDEHTLSRRFPALVATAFGLLHGFGFAAVLGEADLSATELTLGLLFFNLGVELGQLGVVLCLWALWSVALWLLRDRALPKPWLDKSVGYGVGSLACYWLIDRSLSFSALGW